MRQLDKMAEEITKEKVAQLLPKRLQNSHKGTYGSVLNISGSLNYQGAPFLSSVSALRVGCGYVTLASISTVIDNIASKTSDITFLPLRDSYGQCIASDAFSDIKKTIDRYNVVSIGSGLSDKPAAVAFVDEALQYFSDKNYSVIIDADALNAISNIDVKKLPTSSVITPHPKELSRLINVPVEEIQNDRVQYAKFTAQKYSCTVVLKGHRTIIVSGDEVFVNQTGNSALAKAGSGDVLTGMISGFAAQGCSLFDAALIGVYLHGLTGEIASKNLSEYSVLASDLLNYIPLSINSLFL